MRLVLHLSVTLVAAVFLGRWGLQQASGLHRVFVLLLAAVVLLQGLWGILVVRARARYAWVLTLLLIALGAMLLFEAFAFAALKSFVPLSHQPIRAFRLHHLSLVHVRFFGTVGLVVLCALWLVTLGLSQEAEADTTPRWPIALFLSGIGLFALALLLRSSAQMSALKQLMHVPVGGGSAFFVSMQNAMYRLQQGNTLWWLAVGIPCLGLLALLGKRQSLAAILSGVCWLALLGEPMLFAHRVKALADVHNFDGAAFSRPVGPHGASLRLPSLKGVVRSPLLAQGFPWWIVTKDGHSQVLRHPQHKARKASLAKLVPLDDRFAKLILPAGKKSPPKPLPSPCHGAKQGSPGQTSQRQATHKRVAFDARLSLAQLRKTLEKLLQQGICKLDVAFLRHQKQPPLQLELPWWLQIKGQNPPQVLRLTFWNGRPIQAWSQIPRLKVHLSALHHTRDLQRALQRLVHQRKRCKARCSLWIQASPNVRWQRLLQSFFILRGAWHKLHQQSILPQQYHSPSFPTLLITTPPNPTSKPHP